MKTFLVPLVGLLLVAAACTGETKPPRSETSGDVRGIGNMLVFLARERVVSLHTAQSDDQQPLVWLEGVDTLARVVASRL